MLCQLIEKDKKYKTISSDKNMSAFFCFPILFQLQKKK